MNIEQARFNMIEQQIRPWKVLDNQILDLLAVIPREQFVPEAYQGLAFADIAIPLGEDRLMMHPREQGRLLQALETKASDKVLVINSGSGYITALLASIADSVTAYDSSEEFVTRTTENLASVNIKNVTVNCGDALTETSGEQFDVIVILGSMEVLTDDIKSKLSVGGRLFCVIGKEPAMEALLITRESDSNWQEEGLFETLLPAIENAPEAERFHF